MENIEVSHLSKKYGNIEVLSDVSLTLNFKSHYLVVGEKGSGTAEFLDCLSGIECFDGSIKFEGVERTALSNENLKISYIPESPILLCGSVEKNLKYIAKVCGKNLQKSEIKSIAEKFFLNPKQNVKSLSYIEKLFLCFARIEIKKSEIVLINFGENLSEIPKTSGAFLSMISWLNNFPNLLVVAENGQNLASFYDAKILKFKFGVFKPDFSIENELNFPSDIFSFLTALKCSKITFTIENFKLQKTWVGFSVLSQSDINLKIGELNFLSNRIKDFHFGQEVEITKINNFYFLAESGEFLCKM